MGLSLLFALLSASIEVSEAWVRLPPPNMQMTAAYGTLQNTSDKAFCVAEFYAPKIARISLHQTVRRNGVSSMQAVPQLCLAPGETLEMAPGGYHLMLEGFDALKEGQALRICPVSSDGEVIHLDFTVRR